ncbi:MAG: CBS domain-containing protein, partial [Burkholderiaceae bacterium]|nr:CBS domain-containing protein [Burkholderiaceae bacterium]
MSAAAPVVDARQFLRGHAPFSQLREDDLDFLAQHVEAVRFARGDVVLAPGHGAPQACFIVGQGAVEAVRQFGGRRETSADQTVFLVPGDVFPVGALMAQRPASSVYRAAGELDCWRLPKAHFDELLRRSEVFLDFCKRRMAALLELSNQALQASYAAEAAQWRTINAPLESMLRRAPVTCAPDTPIRRVFEEMEKERVGAMLVIETAADGAQSVAGILTRQDVIGRVVLPGVPLDAPIGNVMSAPVLTLDAGESVGAAMLLMAERSIRHVPVTREGRVAGVVTERDLFVLQRRSLRQIGDSIRQARGTGELRVAAEDIRQWSQSLVAQGVSAGFVTRLISRLNDQLSCRLIDLVATR